MVRLTPEDLLKALEAEDLDWFSPNHDGPNTAGVEGVIYLDRLCARINRDRQSND
jgi:hypothetical protein